MPRLNKHQRSSAKAKRNGLVVAVESEIQAFRDLGPMIEEVVFEKSWGDRKRQLCLLRMHESAQKVVGELEGLKDELEALD